MSKSKFIILKNRIKKAESNSFFLLFLHKLFIKTLILFLGPKKFIKMKFKNRTGAKLNLTNPITYNEKLQWLKLNYFQEFYRRCCDKYLIRGYIQEKLGVDLSPKLLFVTNDYKTFSKAKIKKFPCIIKISNGSGQNLIIERASQFTDNQLRKRIRLMLYEASIHANYGCEPQYLPNNPYIVVEDLLTTSGGQLPNDYKLTYNNGVLQYVYCSIDRQGKNVRHLYDESWKRIDGLLLENANCDKYEESMATKTIECPKSFEEMKRIGGLLSKAFPTVRIDFFDVDGSLYIGEITLHHGGGFDCFYPNNLDLKYGSTLTLPEKNFKLGRKNKKTIKISTIVA